MLAGLARWIGFLTMTAAIVGGADARGWLRGLVRSGRFANEEVQLDRKADGIVVLTGAAARIPDAIELLASSAASGC